MKKIFLIIMLSIFSFGLCHAEISWTLSDDGTLTISGTEMPNYGWRESPWDSERILKIIIKEGVTNIGDFAFSDCYNLTSVTMPNSVTNIGSAAFRSCSNLTSVTISNCAKRFL